MTALETFILDRYEPYRRWDRDVFSAWLDWNVHNGFVMRVLDDSDCILGLAIIRPVMNAEDGADFYKYDPEGSVLFIDLLVCDHPQAKQALGFAALKRFGMRESVAWKRAPYYIIKTHSAARLRRHLLRKDMAYGRGR